MQNGGNGAVARSARDRILEAGLEIGIEVGLLGVTYGKAARLAGVRKSTVFDLLGVKDHLWLEVLKEAERRFEAAVLRPARAEQSAVRRVAKLCELALASIQRGDRSTLIVLTECAATDYGLMGQRPNLVWASWRLRGELADAIREASEAGELARRPVPDALAFELDALIRTAAYDRRIEGPSRAVELSRTAMARWIRECSGDPTIEIAKPPRPPKPPAEPEPIVSNRGDSPASFRRQMRTQELQDERTAAAIELGGLRLSAQGDAAALLEYEEEEARSAEDPRPSRGG